ncbi:hypothetical protein BG011_002297 [Mortierella polycephala]|uniref:Swiss Army Knife RNA repair protein HAD domain-containing protein n=1 Tax=Mortierella polycephala TaxID=41804 RepID=A0A9P6Q7U8_9FUNG|nr:hypothetical protein BG011_002297 [Mortierella polycephala]
MDKDQESKVPVFSLLTHPAVVFASTRLQDPAYVERLCTVNVFDFDQTLFQSPLPNPSLWDPSFTGILTSWNYCGTGWWHNPGTLELGPDVEATCWEGWWNEEIVEKVKESSRDPACMTVLLTGRNGPTFGQKLIEMVGRKSLDFDLIVTKPTTVTRIKEMTAHSTPHEHTGHRKSRRQLQLQQQQQQQQSVETYLKVHTFNTKHDFLYNLLFEYPAIRSMHLWDDRPCQVAKFRQAGQEWLKKGMLDHFEITVVQEPLLYMDPQREKELVLRMIEAHNQQIEIEISGGPFLVPGVGAAPRTRPELQDRNIWDPYETYVPQKRLRIEVSRIVRYTGIMFSEAIQRIMKDRIGCRDMDDGSEGTIKNQWIERPLALRGHNLSKWITPNDLHVTLCLGSGTPDFLDTIGGLGATVLVEVEAVGELDGRIWALKVKEFDIHTEQDSQGERPLQIVAPNGNIYSSVGALRAAYTSASQISTLTQSLTCSSLSSSPTTDTPSLGDVDSETTFKECSQGQGKGTFLSPSPSLTHVDLEHLGHVILKKAVPPHITMALDRLNGTHAVDSGSIQHWETLDTPAGTPYPYRLIFVGTIAEKFLWGMKSHKAPAVKKAEVSIANVVKNLAGEKNIAGRELGEMIRCVKKEMERLSVENRLDNEERIATIAQDVCDRVETMKTIQQQQQQQQQSCLISSSEEVDSAD